MKLLIEVKQWILSARPDFDQGVELYKQIFPNNTNFIRLLTQPAAHQSHYNREKLFMDLKGFYVKNRDQIKALEEEEPEHPQPKKVVPSKPTDKDVSIEHLEDKIEDLESDVSDLETQVTDLENKLKGLEINANPIPPSKPNGGTKKDRYPEALHPYIDEQTDLYKRRDYTFYRVQAGVVKGQKNLKVAAKFLKDAEIRIREIWFALDYYDRTQCILPAFQSVATAESFLSIQSRRNTVRTYVSKYTNLAKSATAQEKAGIVAKLQKYTEELAQLEKQLGQK
jgi:hypothetical protein